MTAATPAAGDSWKSRLPARRPALPGCSVPCEPACSGCRPPSRARLSATWCCPSARPSPTHRVWVLATSNWSRWPSGCKAAGSRRRSATRPRFPQRSPGEPLRAWAVADRAVGRRVAPCERPLRDAGDAPRCIPRRRAQVDRWDRDAFLSRLRRAIPDSWNRRLNGSRCNAGSVHRLSGWEATCHTRRKAGRPPSTLAGEIA